VAGPLVLAQMKAGTKGSRPKAHFPLVPGSHADRDRLVRKKSLLFNVNRYCAKIISQLGN
jgi:hypothetical protein